MSEFNNPATKTATTTFDISYAELAGANLGQRPDLLAREQGIYRTPDGKLYSVQGTQLLGANNLVPTYSLLEGSGPTPNMVFNNQGNLVASIIPRLGTLASLMALVDGSGEIMVPNNDESLVVQFPSGTRKVGGGKFESNSLSVNLTTTPQDIFLPCSFAPKAYILQTTGGVSYNIGVFDADGVHASETRV